MHEKQIRQILVQSRYCIIVSILNNLASKVDVLDVFIDLMFSFVFVTVITDVDLKVNIDLIT